MSTEKMFEDASRLKLRFDSTKGMLSVEDLWDLPLTSPTGSRANLDAIAIALNRQTRDAGDEVSFVTPRADNGNAELLLKFEIVKHVIGVRVRERDDLKAASERRAKKDRILELIAKKQDQELESKSEDELRALAESL